MLHRQDGYGASLCLVCSSAIISNGLMVLHATQGPGRHTGPGISVVSEDAMCPRKGLQQRRASRIAVAGAIAEQWFGQLLVAASPADEWLLWGLQGYVQSLFVKTAYGSSEAAYLRLKQRDAVCPGSP
jgi:hypothetical protein